MNYELFIQDIIIIFLPQDMFVSKAGSLVSLLKNC